MESLLISLSLFLSAALTSVLSSWFRPKCKEVDAITDTDSVSTSNDAETENDDEKSSSSQEEDLEAIRRIVRKFVGGIPGATIRFDPPPVDELQVAVVKELNRLGIDIATIKPWLRWGCQVAENFYPDHPEDLKVLIVICNLVIFYIDDLLTRNPSILHQFQPNLLAGRPQGHPILDCLVKDLIPRMWDYFLELPCNSITIGFYEFIIGTAMESVTKQMVHNPAAPRFPEYVRLKSGAPAQYAYWLFPRATHPDLSTYIQAVPDLLAIINRVNDILSFYKEELAGEDDNYVHMRAKLRGQTIPETLEDICDETLQYIDNISATLAGDKASYDAFQGFITRYLRFHTSTTRYRLEELFNTP